MEPPQRPLFPKIRTINVRKQFAIQAIPPLKKTNHDRKCSEVVPKIKRKRVSNTKSRAGCRTCKSRHKKCDEGRPSCFQCIRSGWPCDYIGSTRAENDLVFPLHKTHVKRGLWCTLPEKYPIPSLPSFDSSQDARFLQGVWQSFTHNPACPFEVQLWSILLQLCHEEPCIKHMVLGVAMVREIYCAAIERPNDVSQVEIYRSAVRHYIKAVQVLRSKLAAVKGRASNTMWEVSLLASFGFTLFEVMIDNEEGINLQMQNGLKLVKSILGEYRSKVNLPGNLEEVMRAWNRLDIQASTSSSVHQTDILFSPTIPDRFHGMNDAKQALERVIPSILALIRSRGAEWYRHRLPADPLPEDLNTQLTSLKAILQNWLDVFNNMLMRLQINLYPPAVGQKMTRLRVAHHTLMIQYWTAHIWLRTAFTPSEMAYDPCLATFVSIVDLAEDIVALQPQRKWHYICEIAINYPLFYLVQKCRDGYIRRRACTVLKISGREGIWDGICTAAACEWIIEEEEKELERGLIGSTDPRQSAFVEEKFRLKEATVSVNRLEKTLRVDCMRTKEDGIDEKVEGFVRWEEVRNN